MRVPKVSKQSLHMLNPEQLSQSEETAQLTPVFAILRV